MGVGRLAPHRMRAKYARALAESPLPVRFFDRIDPAALTVLAEHAIADRAIRFGLLPGTDRLWLAFTEAQPSVLGHLTGLRTGRPELHITEPDHIEWARRIKAAALAVWFGAQREYEG